MKMQVNMTTSLDQLLQEYEIISRKCTEDPPDFSKDWSANDFLQYYEIRRENLKELIRQQENIMRILKENK